ncbi:GNAT family N-acetyltransferase [Bacillus sp. 03113]|uniref:GNAT family N-acetyltransferase n=1 Tax=Bacillus sp. 03113 TaxID=2578211 RepID=UPI001144DE3E|nr:GNAT family protein [Bacillus sp. 03113]
MFIHKVDEELSLKLIELKDANRLFELTNHSREYLREWLPWLDVTTKIEDTIDFIKLSLKGYADNQSLTSVILYNGEIVGTAGYHNINWSHKYTSIGYWLDERYQGKGIMTKVVKTLTDYAINDLELNRVEIRVALENKKSRGIPERLGFVNEGRIRQAEWLYDYYVDHVVYGMLADEWNK